MKENSYGIVCINDTNKTIEQIGEYGKDYESVKSKIEELNRNNTDKSKRFALLTVKEKE